MKAYASTLKLIGAKVPNKPKAKGGVSTSHRPGELVALIELQPTTVPFSAVGALSKRLAIEPGALLRLIGIPERTAARRRKKGFLRPEEADRLLRVARVVEDATRIFGSEDKSSRWFSTPHPLLGDIAPLMLLDSDAGVQLVREELIRIDYGDFA